MFFGYFLYEWLTHELDLLISIAEFMEDVSVGERSFSDFFFCNWCIRGNRNESSYFIRSIMTYDRGFFWIIV